MERLVQALQTLPSVGPKTATRLALHLVHRSPDGGQRVVVALTEALDKVKLCEKCRNLSDDDICALCTNTKRDNELLCVVESPSDVIAIEQTAGYDGLYFVLHGHLSPIDGIGPRELGLPMLHQHIVERSIREVIVATGTTVEGETTAHYISEMLSNVNTTVSRIAHGVPVGGELEYSDISTITHALRGRTPIETN